MKKGESIINSYRKLSIGKYYEIMDICKDKDIDELNKQVKIISILADMDEEEVINLPIAEYSEMAANTRFLEGMETRDASPISKVYYAGDYELIPVTDHRKVTAAQYIDFQEYAKNSEGHLVEILSCLLIPKGKKYNQGYDVVEVQKAIRETMPVSDVLTLSAFFFSSFRQLIKDSLTYSRKEAMKIQETERRQVLLERIRKMEELLRTGGAGSQM